MVGFLKHCDPSSTFLFILEISKALFSKRPGELGLERGAGGAQIGAFGLDELDIGGNKVFCVTVI